MKLLRKAIFPIVDLKLSTSCEGSVLVMQIRQGFHSIPF